MDGFDLALDQMLLREHILRAKQVFPFMTLLEVTIYIKF
jgi:hypothetical protein